MKFVVKQAAEAPAEKLVELSIELDCDGYAKVKANGSSILTLRPDGTVSLSFLNSDDRAFGFVADSDDRLKVRNRTPI